MFSIYRWIPTSLKELLTSESGSTAIVFTLCLVPIIAVVGLALDSGRAIGVKSVLQQLNDSAVLNAVQQASTSSDQQLDVTFKSLIERGLNDKGLKSAHTTFSHDQAVGTVTATTTVLVPTTLAGVLGYDGIPVKVTSQAILKVGNLDLALVLDNTGSMNSNGKIQALIAASHQMLGDLQAAAGASGSIRVSIVPFDTRVNIGVASGTAPWMDWSFYSSSDTYGTEPDVQKNGLGSGCTTGNADSSDSDDNNKAKCKPPAVAGVPPNWTGCVIDRDQSYDVSNSTPTPDPATWYPGIDCTLAEIMPLTDDWAALNAKVDQMQASGSTNLTIGLAWGWNMLTPNAPLSTADATTSSREKIMVFLTDGVNTKNAWSSNAAEIDPRTVAICNNIKADNIKLFTIRVVDGNASLLQSCASDPSMFFDVTQSNQLAAAFTSVMHNMAQPHLTQ